MRFVASVLTMLFVASAPAYNSIYGGNVQATSSEKTKTAATAGIKPAPAGWPILMIQKQFVTPSIFT